MSRSCVSIIARRTPRRRCVGWTPTPVTPAHGSEPPGTDSSNGKAPAPPTIAPSSKAACTRSCGSVRAKSSSSSSLGGGLKYWPMAPIARLVEEGGRQVVAAPAVQHPRRGVQQCQPLLGAGHTDVAEPPLLLDPLLLDRARVREDPLFHADEVDGAELEPLRVV